MFLWAIDICSGRTTTREHEVTFSRRSTERDSLDSIPKVYMTLQVSGFAVLLVYADIRHLSAVH